MKIHSRRGALSSGCHLCHSYTNYKNMKNYLKNWSLIRFFRLLIGVFIIVQSVYIEQWFLLGVGVLYSIMPLLNISSCGVGKCGVPNNRS